jgi:hypothetical protein
LEDPRLQWRQEQEYMLKEYLVTAQEGLQVGGARLFLFGYCFTPTTPKHIRDSWSHYTDTSEPVDGNGVQNIATVQSGFEPATFRSLAHELTKIKISCLSGPENHMRS